MIIQPKLRGFICTTAHPVGCAAHVQEQIDYAKAQPKLANPPKNVLVIGSSTGYGLSSRIVPAFSGGAATIGIFFEKAAEGKRTASAGWYNTAAFEKTAHAEGLYAKSLNGDAFSDALKSQAIDLIKKDLGQVDMVIYSLASPRRTDPKDGATYKSALKPVGAPYSNKNLNTDTGEVNEVSIEPATQDEIDHTVKVMGGEDWADWMQKLGEAGVLTPDVVTVAYSYIGPEQTWRIYKDGTIGQAKKHLEESCSCISDALGASGGNAYVSVNKAVVTQASSAIPVVPLYISLLIKKMKEMDLHEDCIQQIQRLFSDFLSSDATPPLDEFGRIRIDDWEMRDDIQDHVAELWEKVDTANLSEFGDLAGYKENFLKLFGFGIEGVDYEADIDPAVDIPSLA